MGCFKYDEEADREWLEIELHPDCPISRARIQDYARSTHRKPETWVSDALVWFMHECDRQGAHGSREYLYPKVEKKRVPLWRTQIADRLYGWADKIAGLEDVGGSG